MGLGQYKAVIYCGQCLCVACLPPDHNSEDVEPIFKDTEIDSYPLCALCGELHDYMRISIKEWEVNNPEAFDVVNW